MHSQLLPIVKTPQELLAEFRETGRQEPFEEIVRRYAGMVYHACYAITRDKHDAEDATQAVFLTLAVKGKGPEEIEYLAAWLRQVANRVSLDIRRSKKRRGRREEVHSRIAAMMDDPSDASTPLHNTELRKILSEELNQLPAKYRLPLILHYFGGLSRDEMARELKVKPATLSVRMFRGREILSSRLAERGVTLTGLGLGIAVSEIVTSTVTDTLVERTAAAAVSYSAGHSVAPMCASPTVIALVDGAIRGMAFARFRMAGLLVLIGGSTMAATGSVYTTLVPPEMQFKLPKSELPPLLKDWNFKLPGPDSWLPSLLSNAGDKTLDPDPLFPSPVDLGTALLPHPGAVSPPLDGSDWIFAQPAGAFPSLPPLAGGLPENWATTDTTSIQESRPGVPFVPAGGLPGVARTESAVDPATLGTLPMPQPTVTRNPPAPAEPAQRDVAPRDRLNAQYASGDPRTLTFEPGASIRYDYEPALPPLALADQPGDRPWPQSFESTGSRRPAWPSIRGSGRAAPALVFDNTMMVIADGGGADRVLDLSQIASITNSIENPPTGRAGWYAENTGSLLLASVDVPAGDSTVVWGEDPSDPVPDLVNSLRLDVDDAAVPAPMSIALVDSRNSRIPPLPASTSFIGLWEMDYDGMARGGMHAIVRYDHSRAHLPQTLKVWEFDSEKEAWMQVPGIQVDTTQHLVFAKLTHADWFGVSVDIPTIGGVTFVTNSGGGLVSVSPITPEPAGVVLLVLGASATLLRRRRRVDFGHR